MSRTREKSHPPVGAGAACPKYTHKNKNEYNNRRGRVCLPEYTHMMILKYWVDVFGRACTWTCSGGQTPPLR